MEMLSYQGVHDFVFEVGSRLAGEVDGTTLLPTDFRVEEAAYGVCDWGRGDIVNIGRHCPANGSKSFLSDCTFFSSLPDLVTWPSDTKIGQDVVLETEMSVSKAEMSLPGGGRDPSIDREDLMNASLLQLLNSMADENQQIPASVSFPLDLEAELLKLYEQIFENSDVEFEDSGAHEARGFMELKNSSEAALETAHGIRQSDLIMSDTQANHLFYKSHEKLDCWKFTDGPEITHPLPMDQSFKKINATASAPGMASLQLISQTSPSELEEDFHMNVDDLILFDEIDFIEREHFRQKVNAFHSGVDIDPEFKDSVQYTDSDIVPLTSMVPIMETEYIDCRPRSPDHEALITNNSEHVISSGKLIAAKGNQGVDIDWVYEKDLIVSKMLGKRTTRKDLACVDVQMQSVVEDFENYWRDADSTSGQEEERSLSCFRRTITRIMNSYCEQQQRRVRYLPDFCKKALNDWVETDDHSENPYPDKEEIRRLAEELGLSKTQVEQWFENFRVRLWQPQQRGIRKGKFFRYPAQRTAVLREWILEHKMDPNPRGKDLESLIEKTGMTSAQVKQWCYNFRRRHRKELYPDECLKLKSTTSEAECSYSRVSESTECSNSASGQSEIAPSELFAHT